MLLHTIVWRAFPPSFPSQFIISLKDEFWEGPSFARRFFLTFLHGLASLCVLCPLVFSLIQTLHSKEPVCYPSRGLLVNLLALSFPLALECPSCFSALACVFPFPPKTQLPP